MPRAVATLLLVVAALALPAAALAQSAGDDQYVDPFEGGEQAQEQPQPEAPAEPAPTPEASPEAPAAEEATAQPEPTAPTLPRTGLPALGAFAAGAVLIAAGAALRRRC
jgi:hypothetical protein